MRSRSAPFFHYSLEAKRWGCPKAQGTETGIDPFSLSPAKIFPTHSTIKIAHTRYYIVTPKSIYAKSISRYEKITSFRHSAARHGQSGEGRRRYVDTLQPPRGRLSADAGRGLRVESGPSLRCSRRTEQLCRQLRRLLLWSCRQPQRSGLHQPPLRLLCHQRPLHRGARLHAQWLLCQDLRGGAAQRGPLRLIHEASGRHHPQGDCYAQRPDLRAQRRAPRLAGERHDRLGEGYRPHAPRRREALL